ncbi:MAG TPA: hypothetical protein VLA16_02070, partial [Ideonella sp.]|nr:hypothetical protein [Ideonella sp.]
CLAGIGAWLRDHPVGLAVSARLSHAAGRHQQAEEEHQACLDSMRAGAPPYLAALADAYAGWRAGDSRAMPAAPRLASLL